MEAEAYIKAFKSTIRESIKRVIIQHHKKYGICVRYLHKYNLYTIITILYFDQAIGLFILDKYASTSNHKLVHAKFSINYCIDGGYLSRIVSVKEDFRNYKNLYKYGCITDVEKFYNILRLFLVLPRDARPINRLAFLDISVKTTRDT